MDTSIYKFNSHYEFLSSIYAVKKRKNPSFSLRAWSQQLGFKNPSMLSSVIRGTRALKPALAARIAQSLEMPATEQRYFELLALVHNARGAEEKALYIDLANTLRPDDPVTSVELEQFRLIADWYHLTILEMVLLADFDPSPTAIAQRLGGAIEPAMAATALKRLVALGLIRQTKAGKYEQTAQENYIGRNITDAALRTHLRQLIERGMEAIEQDAVGERDVKTTSIPLKTKDIPKVFELIAKFHSDLRKLAAADKADDVFCVNTQGFKLTKSTQEIHHAKLPAKGSIHAN